MVKLVKLLPLFILALIACNLSDRLDKPTERKNVVEPQPTIEYSKPRWSNEANVYHLLSFQVKNTSNKNLEFIKISASFYDKAGNFVRSESPYIERYAGLASGEKSNAQVQTEYDPRIKSVELTFSCKGDKPFAKVDLIATQVEKIQ